MVVRSSMLPYGALGIHAIFIGYFLISIRNGFSLSEALDILLNDDMDWVVFIEPPYPHGDTDADFGDEDGSGWVLYFFFIFLKYIIYQIISICNFVDNLNSRQLLPNAKIRLPNNEKLGVNYDILDLDLLDWIYQGETNKIWI